MRRIAWVVIVLIGVAGCGQEKKKESADRGKEKRTAKPALTLSGPSEPVEVLNGKQATLAVKVQWAAAGREELQLSVTVTPAEKGVTAKAEQGTLKREDDQAAVIVTVGEAAASGDYKVKLTTRAASAGSGTTLMSQYETSWEGTVRVPKKD
jgi:hypothetical protein